MAERSCGGPGHDTLDAYGWSPEVAERLAGLEGPGAPARVVRTDRGAVLAASRAGLVHAGTPPGLDPAPVAGDWLLVDGAPPRVVAVAPRSGALVRRDEHQSQTLASGVDEVFVVCGLDRPVATGPLDRALVVACAGGARPLVVLAKADLSPDPHGVAGTVAGRIPGVEVAVTSARDGRGVDALRARLGSRRTIALLGESGVGKSSLVNALAGARVQVVGDVRERDRAGRHTTRARHLVAVGGGTVLVDTPGLRSFGVVGLDDGLRRLFADVIAAGGGCRFADCTHAGEPDCAVAGAVAGGDLAAERVERYRQVAAAVRGGGRPGVARRAGAGRRRGPRR